jgi:Ulp1 family protease
MAMTFVFDDDEMQRAKDKGINFTRLKDTTEESLNKMLNDSIINIFMPFLKEEKENEEIRQDFHNQIIMREIWSGKK